MHAARAVGDLGAIATIGTRLARAYAQRDEPDLARGHIDAALRETHARGDRRGFPSALKSLALLHVATDHPKEAVEPLVEAIRLLHALGRQRGEVLALVTLADTLVDLDRFNETTVYGERAHALLDTLNDPEPFNTARAKISRARAHLGTNDLATAETLANAARETMEQLGSRHEKIRARDLLAEIAVRTGNQQAARDHRAAADDARTESIQ